MGGHRGKPRDHAVDEQSDGKRTRKRPSQELASDDDFLEPSLDHSPPIARHYTFAPEDFDSPPTKSYQKRMSAVTNNSRHHKKSPSKRTTDVGSDTMSSRATGRQETSEQERQVMSGFRQWSEGPMPAGGGNQSMDLSMCMGYDDGDITVVDDDREEEEAGEEEEDGEEAFVSSRHIAAPFLDHSVDFETCPLPKIRESEEELEFEKYDDDEEEERVEEDEGGGEQEEQHFEQYRGQKAPRRRRHIHCSQKRASYRCMGGDGAIRVKGSERGEQGKHQSDGISGEKGAQVVRCDGRYDPRMAELRTLVKERGEGEGEGKGVREGCVSPYESHRLPFQDGSVKGESISTARATVQLNSAEDRWRATVAYDACLRICLSAATAAPAATAATPASSASADVAGEAARKLLGSSYGDDLRQAFGLKALLLSPVKEVCSERSTAERGALASDADRKQDREAQELGVLYVQVKKIRFLSSLHDTHPATQETSLTQNLSGHAEGQNGQGIMEDGDHAGGGAEAAEAGGGEGGGGGVIGSEGDTAEDANGLCQAANADGSRLASVPTSTSVGGRGVRAAAVLAGRRGVRRVMRQIRDTVQALRKGGAGANAAGSSEPQAVVSVRLCGTSEFDSQRVAVGQGNRVSLPVACEEDEVLVEVFGLTGRRYGQGNVPAAFLVDDFQQQHNLQHSLLLQQQQQQSSQQHSSQHDSASNSAVTTSYLTGTGGGSGIAAAAGSVVAAVVAGAHSAAAPGAPAAAAMAAAAVGGRQRVEWVSIRDDEDVEVARLLIAASFVPACSEAQMTLCKPVTPFTAYDWVLDAALASCAFGPRRLRVFGEWRWLVEEYARVNAVSRNYSYLRYLLCVLRMALPTADCLCLILQLLAPVIEAHDDNNESLTARERRLLADAEERVVELVELVFRSYKALSESAPSGMMPPVTVPGLTNQKSSNYTLAPSPNMGSPSHLPAAAAAQAHASSGPYSIMGRQGCKGEGQEDYMRGEEENKENMVSRSGMKVEERGGEGNKPSDDTLPRHAPVPSLKGDGDKDSSRGLGPAGRQEERGERAAPRERGHEVMESAGGRSPSGAGQSSDSDPPAAPALAPAVALFTLLFDCEREEVQEALREHLRVAAEQRSSELLSPIGELVRKVHLRSASHSHHALSHASASRNHPATRPHTPPPTSSPIRSPLFPRSPNPLSPSPSPAKPHRGSANKINREGGVGGEDGVIGGLGFRVTWTGGLADTLGVNIGGGAAAHAGSSVGDAPPHAVAAVAVDSSEAERAYRCVRWVCGAVWKEIHRDIRIHNMHVFPGFIDLPHITASVLLVDLHRTLLTFLAAIPPVEPCHRVKSLLHSAADVEDNLAAWGVGKVPGSLDAREIFGPYVNAWIADRRHFLLSLCSLPKWSGMTSFMDKNATSAFIEELYVSISAFVEEMDSVAMRWPEYSSAVERAICDAERTALTFLASHFTPWLQPLAQSTVRKRRKFSISLLSRRKHSAPYQVPMQIGVYLNTIKHMIENLRPSVQARMRRWVDRTNPAVRKMQRREAQSLRGSSGASRETPLKRKSWETEGEREGEGMMGGKQQKGASHTAYGRTTAGRWTGGGQGNMGTEQLELAMFGVHFSNVGDRLKETYRSTLQMVVERLHENAQLSPSTSLISILKDLKPTATDDMTVKLQPLCALLGSLLTQADAMLSRRVFVGVTRGLWDRHGRDLIAAADGKKVLTSWFQTAAASLALEILDNTFVSLLQKMVNRDELTTRDFEPPRAVEDARKMLATGVKPEGLNVRDSLNMF